MTPFQIGKHFAGPPTMGHGGYVAGRVVEQWLSAPGREPGAVQVTLRSPTPFDIPLSFTEDERGKLCLSAGEQLLVEAQGASLSLELPPLPSAEQARAAEAGSPSHYNAGRGVHPICFGCSTAREPGQGLRIFVGPCEVDERPLVAALWRPPRSFAEGDAGGVLPVRYVLAALDCPGAFAFIAQHKRAGLLGRIVFEQQRPVYAGADYRVVGWQIGEQGRKLFAGTALFDEAGRPSAAAKATWFGPHTGQGTRATSPQHRAPGNHSRG